MATPDPEQDLPPGGLRRYLVHVLRGALDRRLDRVERLLSGPRQAGGEAATPSPRDEPRDQLPAHESPGVGEPAAALKALLDRAMDQTQEQSEEAWFQAVLGSLVPDEALILSALSDGARHPMLHVAAGSWLGAPQQLVAENISSIGRTAGIQWLEMTPAYVGRLRRWGFIELGAEDAAQAANYEILETDDAVIRAVQLARQYRGERAVILRHTIRLSAAGQRFWAACHRGR